MSSRPLERNARPLDPDAQLGENIVEEALIAGVVRQPVHDVAVGIDFWRRVHGLAPGAVTGGAGYVVSPLGGVNGVRGKSACAHWTGHGSPRLIYPGLWQPRSAQASASNPFHRPLTHHAKVDRVDQIRTECLVGADGGHRLSQRADVRSERHDAAQHRGNRPDGGDLI